MQSGTWAGKNIIEQMNGKFPKPFHYLDKGTMAMIGRNAAIAAIPIAITSSMGRSRSPPGSASTRC